MSYSRVLHCIHTVMTVTARTQGIFKIKCNEFTTRAKAKINPEYPSRRSPVNNGLSAERLFLKHLSQKVIKATKTVINIKLILNINAITWYNKTVTIFSNFNSNRKMIQTKIPGSSYLSNFINLVLRILHNHQLLIIIIVNKVQLSSTKMKWTPINSPKSITLKMI